MTTTVERVERYLETDLVLHEVLARGILNVRQAARWLIEGQGWDTTEEAVVSALRRYKPRSNLDLETVLHLLSESDFLSRSGLAMITVPWGHQYMERMSAVFDAQDPEDTLIVLQERRMINVLVEDRNAEAVADALCDGTPHRLHRDVAELQIRFPEPGSTASTAVAVFLNFLGLGGINVLSLFGTIPVCSVIVPGDQVSLAQELTETLTTRDVEFSRGSL